MGLIVRPVLASSDAACRSSSRMTEAPTVPRPAMPTRKGVVIGSGNPEKTAAAGAALVPDFNGAIKEARGTSSIARTTQ